jgi:phosphatidylglycerol---prolipoprotein diacylglyceryl transferase
MHPILFTIPGLDFPVRTFGVLVALGFILGTYIFAKLVARYSSEPERDVERFSAAPVWVLVGIVIGARLMYVIVEVARGSAVGHEYLDQPWRILAIWQGGLVMYGGLFGGLIAGTWCVKRKGLPLYHGMDLGLTAAFFGQAIGRVGCLMVGDDYGKVVPEQFKDLPFPITIHVPNPLPAHSLFGEENAGQVLWATQTWMSAKALICGCIGLWLLKRRKYPGQVSLVLLLVYAILRYTIELFRGDSVRGVWFGGAISTSQILALATGLVSFALLLVFRKRTESVPQT